METGPGSPNMYKGVLIIALMKVKLQHRCSCTMIGEVSRTEVCLAGPAAASVALSSKAFSRHDEGVARLMARHATVAVLNMKKCYEVQSF